MDFFFFILVTATLFIRPAEVVPALLGLPIYEVLILTCLALSAKSVLGQLSPRSLARNPVTVCSLGLLVAIELSHLSHAFFWGMKASGLMFAKVLLYYLLLVGVLNNPVRLRRFLSYLVGFIVVLTVLALLQYHGFINIASLEALRQHEINESTGEILLFTRLRSTGIYNDPNDLSLVLVGGLLVCLHRLAERGRRLSRLAWMLPVGLFGYAFTLTQSRGGFLSLAAGLLALFGARLGWRRALLGSAVVLPALLLVAGGRQTSISTSESTSQERIQIWSEGLGLFRQAPLFGIGHGEFAEHVGLVAHNSFVHCYAELGFLGGTLFLGAFYCAVVALLRLGARPTVFRIPAMQRLRPCVLALVVAYAVGLLSLSRPYVVPTYLILGLATAFVRVGVVPTAGRKFSFDLRLARRLALVSTAFLVGIYLFVRTFVHWG